MYKSDKDSFARNDSGLWRSSIVRRCCKWQVGLLSCVLRCFDAGWRVLTPKRLARARVRFSWFGRRAVYCGSVPIVPMGRRGGKKKPGSFFLACPSKLGRAARKLLKKEVVKAMAQRAGRLIYAAVSLSSPVGFRSSGGYSRVVVGAGGHVRGLKQFRIETWCRFPLS